MSESHTTAPLSAVNEAADWYARLNSGSANDEEHRRWRAWHEVSADNRKAWLKIEQVCACFSKVPAKLGVATLSSSMQSASRRTMLRSMAAFAALGGSGVLAYRVLGDQGWRYDYATAVGERKDIVLADGSRLSINTDSRVDVMLGAEQRIVRLRRGEVMVSTHPDTAGRPFLVETGHGRVRALGTRFNVRDEGPVTRVAVLDKMVEIAPLRTAERVRIAAGEEIEFSADAIEAPGMAPVSAGTWASGRLVVVNMPLRQLLAELSRYRPGYLSCDDAIGDLAISGAFPLDNTEQALLALTEAFPVKMDRYTRYWIRVMPAKS